MRFPSGFVLVLFILIAYGAKSQEGAMEGIDAHFMQAGYYDDLEDAVANADSALYLDLSLQSPKLKNVPADVFKLKKLRYLELGFNQISTVDERILQLKDLEVLGLDGNRYLKSLYPNLSGLGRLREIHVKETGLSNEQIGALRAVLPKGCKLIH